ncbi:Gamma-glutamyltransferase [Lentibacillus sp. JNUCC-1]|uniref:gamma-glutamyltransferase family protein n=1 Tax=Lentibacillus sp. JNUCC-1 TaxID=2654513 RepID=UPI0012E98DE5|nr:gamma-glutamyltransferase family protein [Lentibacillus sp. JNUCC-1]MUV39038.1 Gamma-glutamyltransferase [Lentibacillus sp. JNUCC-1]
MHLDSLYHPYPSQRMTTYSRKGMVATSQPIAAQIGVDILKQGGNAVDAAIATAAALTVVEPTTTGVGGDAFAIVWMNEKMYGINGSGPAPESISIDAVKELGYEAMPKYGFIPVTVPGAPATWAALSERFGNLSLRETLQPAINYAREGFALTPVLGKYWERAYHIFKEHTSGEAFTHWFETFAKNGPPKIGDMWASEDLARTLERIGDTGAEAFYRGELADQIDAFSKKHGGFLSRDDLAKYRAEWVDPISVNYRGYDVWELPPNSQGLVALMALNILEGFEFGEKETVATYHKQMEAMKLAFADGFKHITEEHRMMYTPEELMNLDYIARRRALIGERALMPEAGEPRQGGTVYLAAADGDGNMVSFIQSNYMGFGSGLVVPGTGISLQNRGYDFSLDPSHINALKGGKKTFHTIIPGFMTEGDQAVGPFGVMGGFMMPHGHVQLVMNTIDFHLNPQAALDAPRWQWMKNKLIKVEPGFPLHIAQALGRKGHQIEYAGDHGGFGRGQIIWRNSETGVLMGGTESRTDGSIAVW